MILQKIRDIKDANKCTAKTSPIMKEGRLFEVDTPNKCTICYQHYTSPMELMKHMLSHNSSESHAPTMPAKNDECNICVEIKKIKPDQCVNVNTA